MQSYMNKNVKTKQNSILICPSERKVVLIMYLNVGLGIQHD